MYCCILTHTSQSAKTKVSVFKSVHSHLSIAVHSEKYVSFFLFSVLGGISCFFMSVDELATMSQTNLKNMHQCASKLMLECKGNAR